MPDEQRDLYLAVIDDATQEMVGYELEVFAPSREAAQMKAQDAFPYGIVRQVLSRAELEEIAEVEVMRAKALAKRAEDNETLTRALSEFGVVPRSLD